MNKAEPLLVQTLPTVKLRFSYSHLTVRWYGRVVALAWVASESETLQSLLPIDGAQRLTGVAAIWQSGL